MILVNMIRKILNKFDLPRLFSPTMKLQLSAKDTFGPSRLR